MSDQSTGGLLFEVEDGKFESGGASAVIEGEVELEIIQKETVEEVRLVRLGLYSPQLVSWRGSTGELSITAQRGEGQVREGRLQLNLQAEVQFVERTESGYTMLAGLASTVSELPRLPIENFAGTLEGVLEPPGPDGARALREATLRLGATSRLKLDAPFPAGAADMAGPEKEGAEGAAEELNLKLNAIPKVVTPMAGCPPQRQSTVRILRIQPVFFQGDATHPLATGATFDAQVNAARLIWGECCIQLDVEPPIFLSNSNASRSGSFNTVVSALPLANRLGNAVHVFVVENHLPPGDGGGLQFGSDIVITDDNAGNPTLLAHEIGHVFSLS